MSFTSAMKWLWALAIFFALGACAPTAVPPPEPTDEASAGPVKLRIAILPIIDTLPMYVAQQEGLFAANNVSVEFIPVASAPERDQLLAADQADAAINETLAVMFFNQESVRLQVVRYALRPEPGFGHFFILASAQSGIQSPEGLKGVEIGVSQGTIIEYVTERLLQAEGFTQEDIHTIGVPKIPDRMSLLASGGLQAGVLPDPLASLAVSQGARPILDDAAHPEYGFSVIAFRKEVIDEHPEAVRGFLAAIEDATKMLNSGSSAYQSVLSEQKLVPEPLIGKYRIPPFPTAEVPTEEEWQDALRWAKQKGMLTADVSYSDSVDGSLLP